MHGPTCIFWASLTPFSLKFGEIISDVLGDGGGVFPWHVVAARWLDGDTAEDAFIAALDTVGRSVDL